MMRASFPASTTKRIFGAGRAPMEDRHMKPNLSFSKKPHTSLLLATATLLLLSMQGAIFADDGTWNSSGSTDWNIDGNWLTNPAGGGYPGTTVGNTATFDNMSSVTSLFVTATLLNDIAAI